MKTSLGAGAIAYPTPVFVIGTHDDDGTPNFMTVSWGGICCSRPPCVSISVRKSRHTYNSLIRRKAFTVNLPSEAQIKEADYFGSVSGRERDKLADTNLTARKSDLVEAPYLDEFPLVLECRVIQVHEIGVHIQFIGEILDIKADAAVLDERGRPDPELVKPFWYAPEQGGYYGIGERIGTAYAMGTVFKKD